VTPRAEELLAEILAEVRGLRGVRTPVPDQALEAVFAEFAEQPFFACDVIERATAIPNKALRAPLQAWGVDVWAGGSAMALGHKLKKFAGHVTTNNELRLESLRKGRFGARYRIVRCASGSARFAGQDRDGDGRAF
jgi:hypothetical protein